MPVTCGGTCIVSDIAEFCYYPHGFYDFGGGHIYDAPPSWCRLSFPAESTASPNTLNPYYVLELPTNLVMHITMAYTASNQTAVLTATTNGVPVGVRPVPGVEFTDQQQLHRRRRLQRRYVLDHQLHQHRGRLRFDPGPWVVANLRVDLPPPAQNLVGALLSNGVWQVQFTDRTNWLYTLERTLGFDSGERRVGPAAGNIIAPCIWKS